MEKTLPSPPPTDRNLLTEKNTAENTAGLEQLTDELKPYMEAAAQQLLKPDEQVVNNLLGKISS